MTTATTTTTASPTTRRFGDPAHPRGSGTRLGTGWRTIAAGLLGGAAIASGIALTATSGWLIVRANERPVILTLLTAIVAVRTFGLARPLLRYAERLVSHDSALRELATERTTTFRRLIPLTPARLGRRRRGDLLTGVVDDLGDVIDRRVRVTVPVISAAVAGLVAVALTASVAPAVGAVIAALLVVVALASAMAWRLEARGQDELSSARAEVARLTELVTHQGMAVRSVHGEARLLGRLDQAQTALADRVLRQSLGRTLFSAIVLGSVGASTAAVAFLVTRAGSGVDHLGGPITALLILVPVATADALVPLVDAMRALARAQGARRRLVEVLDQSPAVTDRAAADLHGPDQPGLDHAGLDHAGHDHSGDPIHLSLTAVSAEWVPGRPALAPTSTAITPGEHVAIIGPNGSGKSTLLAVIARHLDPASGTYRVETTDVTELPLSQVRNRFAIVDDEVHVFASTLRENLRLAAPEAPDSDLVKALRAAGLGSWFDALPDALGTALGTGGRGISGGERARLGLARAVLSARPAVLLDEPVAHLDPATAREVLADVRAATRGRTLVMVTHREEGLEEADRLIELATAPTVPAANACAARPADAGDSPTGGSTTEPNRARYHKDSS